jgi:subtilase family serine protease
LKVDGEKTYKVNAGDTVRVQFTYENNGANTQGGVKVGFYVSTNNLITTRDDRLGGTTMTLGRNSVYTTEHSVSLPSTLTSGEYYWLGAIIDEEDNVSEEVEWNNATYLPIKVN